jgi:two-component system CheB/CheR fusion protein
VDTSSRLRVLVVDDYPDAADTLAILVQKWGHEVQTAYEGNMVLQLAENFQPHAILLDIGLKGKDGYKVARSLRARDEFKETVVVAVTGFADDGHRREAMESGFDFFLVKPLELEQLSDILTYHCHASRSAKVI